MPKPDANIGTILKIGDSVFEFVEGKCLDCAFTCRGNCKPHSDHPVLGDVFDAIVPVSCEGVSESDQPSFILKHISGPLETPFTSIPKCPVCETRESAAPTGYELHRDTGILDVDYMCRNCRHFYTIGTPVSLEAHEAVHNKSAESDKPENTTYEQFVDRLALCPVCKRKPTVLATFIPAVKSDSVGLTDVSIQCRDCKISVGPHMDFVVAGGIWNRLNSNSVKEVSDENREIKTDTER